VGSWPQCREIRTSQALRILEEHTADFSVKNVSPIKGFSYSQPGGARSVFEVGKRPVFPWNASPDSPAAEPQHVLKGKQEPERASKRARGEGWVGTHTAGQEGTQQLRVRAVRAAKHPRDHPTQLDEGGEHESERPRGTSLAAPRRPATLVAEREHRQGQQKAGKDEGGKRVTRAAAKEQEFTEDFKESDVSGSADTSPMGCHRLQIPEQSCPGAELVGERVRVWWDGDGDWFSGSVSRHCPRKKRTPHYVQVEIARSDYV